MGVVVPLHGSKNGKAGIESLVRLVDDDMKRVNEVIRGNFYGEPTRVIFRITARR